MKRLIVLFLTAVMCLSLAACGSDGGDTTQSNTDSPTTPNENKKGVTALVLGETYSLEDYADITLSALKQQRKLLPL